MAVDERSEATAWIGNPLGGRRQASPPDTTANGNYSVQALDRKSGAIAETIQTMPYFVVRRKLEFRLEPDLG